MSIENTLEIIRVVILLLSSVAIPAVIFLVGNRVTNIRQLEEKLRSDRIEIYDKALKPFFLSFSTEAQIKAEYGDDEKRTGAELAAEKMSKIDYHENAFKLTLVGSDDVVRAYNNLMQAYSNLPDNDKYGFELMRYVSVLLLEVRKSLGNQSTKLHPLEMLEWKITDIRKHKSNRKYPNMNKYYRHEYPMQ